MILFIDELHTLVGRGKSEERDGRAATSSSSMLARGELHRIAGGDHARRGTVSTSRKGPGVSSARRFQPVKVDQPTVEDTISILRGLKERYESHHKVRIRDSALVAAAVLSNRYIADRFLPDKAIDLVDESAAKLRTEMDSRPTALDEINRQVMQLEIEAVSLRAEGRLIPASKDRLAKLEKDLTALKEQQSALDTLRRATEKPSCQGSCLNCARAASSA